MSESFPIQRRDRPWADSHVAYLIGPLPMPPTSEVRAAAARIVRAYPDSRIHWGMDGGGQRWTTGQLPESLVTESIWDDSKQLGEIVDAMRSDAAIRHPLAFVRFPNYLGMAMSHAVADGRNGIAMIEAVAHGAISGGLPDYQAHPSGRFPLLSAALRTFGRRPTLVRDALADRHPSEDPAASDIRVPWSASRRTVVASVPRPLGVEMASRAEELGVKASFFSLMTCALLRALNGAGIEAARDVIVMVDLRRYLGSDWIDGNFVAAVPMRIGVGTTPQELSGMIGQTMRSGRPLASQMLSSTRVGGRRRPSVDVPNSMDPHAPARITLSDLGNVPRTSGLQFLEGQSSVCAATAVPDGPHGVTFAFAHTPTDTVITVAFHDNVTDAGKLDCALRALATDPAGLLFGRSLAR